jgi:excisionase family DNA binding protein
MNNSAKLQLTDYLSFMESAGKISREELIRLKKALEPHVEKSSPSPPNVFLTRKQSAQALGVSTRTLDRLRKRGEISCRRVGERGIRFTLEDVMNAVVKETL